MDGRLRVERRHLRDVALFVRDHLKDTITTDPGVGDVQLGGYRRSADAHLALRQPDAAACEITSEDVIDAVNDQNQLAPTGFQDNGDRETYVRVHSRVRATPKECDATS